MNKKEETFESKITGAIARGYCSEENENKVLDADLCIAMVKEVMPEVQQEIDRAREETLNDFWTYFDEGKSELLELEDKGSMSLEEIEWDFGEERFKEYINKLTI